MLDAKDVVGTEQEDTGDATAKRDFSMKKHGPTVHSDGTQHPGLWWAKSVKKRRSKNKQAKKSRKENR